MEVNLLKFLCIKQQNYLSTLEKAMNEKDLILKFHRLRDKRLFQNRRQKVIKYDNYFETRPKLESQKTTKQLFQCVEANLHPARHPIADEDPTEFKRQRR